MFQDQNGTLNELLTSKYITSPVFRVRISGFQSFSYFSLLFFFVVVWLVLGDFLGGVFWGVGFLFVFVVILGVFCCFCLGFLWVLFVFLRLQGTAVEFWNLLVASEW